MSTTAAAHHMPSIAIVMPAYNEANRIEQTLASIARYRAAGAPIGPVIVADDGSDDDTVEVARRAAEREGLPVEILSFPHRGKASTVRSAMLDAAPRVGAEYLMMLDADDELPIDQLDRVEWSDDPNSIYIGRRVGAVGAATAARPSLLRRSMSVVMRIASRTLLGIRFPDTQCGFKLFPRSVVGDLFGQQRSTGWTFDAELLYIADRVSRLPIIEIPVVWTPRGVSRVRPAAAVISGLAMFGTAFRRIRRVYRPVVVRVTGSGAEPAVSR
jgi:dolichyl-phosphate beta-glucosyltransferase